MTGPLHRFLAADHRRLDELLKPRPTEGVSTVKGLCERYLASDRFTGAREATRHQFSRIVIDALQKPQAPPEHGRDGHVTPRGADEQRPQPAAALAGPFPWP